MFQASFILSDSIQLAAINFKKAASTFLISENHIATTESREIQQYQESVGLTSPQIAFIFRVVRYRLAQLQLLGDLAKILLKRITWQMLVLSKN